LLYLKHAPLDTSTGATNNASANMFIHCNASVWCEACYDTPKDKWCNLPLNDTDPGDTMIAALHKAMARLGIHSIVALAKQRLNMKVNLV
jgi:hypothetical protein